MKKIFLVAVFVLASIGLTAQNIERPVEPRKPFIPLLSILIPCGVPQFYNGEWIKGTAILGAEVGSLAGMVAFSQSYSTSQSNNDLAAFGACWGINVIAAGYCIVDSFIADSKYSDKMNKYKLDLNEYYTAMKKAEEKKEKEDAEKKIEEERVAYKKQKELIDEQNRQALIDEQKRQADADFLLRQMEESERIANQQEEEEKQRQEKEIQESREKIENSRNKFINKATNFYKSPIIILSSWSSSPNSANGVDYNFSIRNVSTKTIKYIYVSAVAYNRVDDPVEDELTSKSEKTGKITGPIGINENYESTFKTMWYNSTIEYAKISEINIIFMDKSEIKITDQDEIKGLMLPDDLKYTE